MCIYVYMWVEERQGKLERESKLNKIFHRIKEQFWSERNIFTHFSKFVRVDLRQNGTISSQKEPAMPILACQVPCKYCNTLKRTGSRKRPFMNQTYALCIINVPHNIFCKRLPRYVFKNIHLISACILWSFWIYLCIS